MNAGTSRSLKRLLREMERTSRRGGPGRRKFATSPLVLVLGLALGDVLLVKLVPELWANVLPGGLEQAATLRGAPALVWRLAWFLAPRQALVAPALGGLAAALFVLAYYARWVRWACWLGALATIGLDAWILVTALRAGLGATAEAAGIDPGALF